MLAVVKIGSSEYLVEEGSVIDVQKLDGEANKKLTLTEIKLINDGKKTLVGQPLVKGASIEATIEEQGKSKKEVVFKFKRKTGYKKTQGHRQPYTRLKITKISQSSSKAADKETKETAKA